MNFDARYTDGRVPEAGIRGLFADEHRWQRWLDVEAALAVAEAENGIIPSEAAQAIKNAADVRKLDTNRIQTNIKKMSHPLMALVKELSDAVGDDYGGYVHWGATTQNIMQTGDALVIREINDVFLHLLGKMFASLESLTVQGQSMVCAGRTHGQHAVPITFGFKTAVWIEELANHVDRFHEGEPRLFTAMVGGAVGNYASLGEKGPAVQDKIAKMLNLHSMSVPSRAMADFRAEYICLLGLLAGTGGKIAKEIAHLMQPEFGEVHEPIPHGTIGSSTMPHKRNPQLSDDCLALSAQIRAQVPFALEGMMGDHEGNGAYYDIIDDATKRACILTGDLLTRLNVILSGLILNEKRMRDNLDLSGDLIMSEAVMLKLGEVIGRQEAHELIYEKAQHAATGNKTFKELLFADARITKHLDKETLTDLLDPIKYVGLSVKIAKDAAQKAHMLALKLK